MLGDFRNITVRHIAAGGVDAGIIRPFLMVHLEAGRNG